MIKKKIRVIVLIILISLISLISIHFYKTLKIIQFAYQQVTELASEIENENDKNVFSENKYIIIKQYNASVEEYNTLISEIPNFIYANIKGYKAAPYYKAPKPYKKAPKVEF